VSEKRKGKKRKKDGVVSAIPRMIDTSTVSPIRSAYESRRRRVSIIIAENAREAEETEGGSRYTRTYT